MSRRLLGGATVIAAIALVTIGCGSSKSKTAAPATKADFAKAANSLCTSLQASYQSVGSLQTMADLVANGDAAIKAKRDGLARMEKLEPPAELKSAFNDWISIVKKRISANEAILNAAKKGNTAEVERLARADHSASNKALAADAAAIGAPACGR
jgi:hypothetical protein